MRNHFEVGKCTFLDFGSIFRHKIIFSDQNKSLFYDQNKSFIDKCNHSSFQNGLAFDLTMLS